MRHVTVMALSSTVGLMAVFLVDFVDMVFIGMLGKAELAAAIGYAGAILFFTGSFGVGMAIACGALVARALGQDDGSLAQSRATHSLIAGFGFGAIFAALVWLNLNGLVTLLGAVGDVHDLSVHFMQIMLPSMPVLLLGVVGGAILRAHGDARRSMYVLISGGIVNAILDPILIFGFDMELTGAAVSSVIARCVIAGSALWTIQRYHGGFGKPTPQGLWRDLPAVFTIAGPAILAQLATPVGQAYVTRAMSEYGEQAVAGMALIGRLTPVAFGVIFALSGAVGPIIGQNAGAGQADRVRQAYRDGLLFTAVVTVAVSAFLFLLRQPLTALFQLEGIAQQLVFLFAGPLSLLWYFNGMIFVSNAACNNLGRPFYATLVNWGRHTLGTVPFVIVFAWWLGAPGVLIGQSLGGVVFGVLGGIVASRLIARGGDGGPKGPMAGQRTLFRIFQLRH